jgi:hypothetical protein
MPAFLAKDDRATGLREDGTTPDEAKPRLKTIEGMNWKMSTEERAT